MFDPAAISTAHTSDQTTATVQHVLFYDFETRSTVDLKEAGAFAYAEAAETVVTVCCYCVNDGLTHVWLGDAGMPIPWEFHEAATNPTWEKRSWNNQFERCLEELTLHPRIGWPLAPIERHACTMTEAITLSLPRAIEDASKVLRLNNQKDMKGHKTMMRMCKPLPWIKGKPPKSFYEEDPDRWNILIDYCGRDVAALLLSASYFA
jgi:DNA polymerase bacteriophage-type